MYYFVYNKQSLKFYEQRTYFSDLQATEIINIDKSLFRLNYEQIALSFVYSTLEDGYLEALNDFNKEFKISLDINTTF